MSLNAQEVAKLRRIVSLAERLIGAGSKLQRNGEKHRAGQKRTRRSGKELVQFRKMLKAERKAGVPVGELARKHGISSAYIYML